MASAASGRAGGVKHRLCTSLPVSNIWMIDIVLLFRRLCEAKGSLFPRYFALFSVSFSVFFLDRLFLVGAASNALMFGRLKIYLLSPESHYV